LANHNLDDWIERKGINGAGSVSQLIVRAVEGDFKAVRQELRP
jgi:hypothetical protein